jgi:hypothetical protein
MELILLLVVIASTVWVGVDANKRTWNGPGPWSWALGCLLLWIVVFPLYLWRRRSAPLKASSEDQNNALDPPAAANVLPSVVGPSANVSAAAAPQSGGMISDLDRLAMLHANGVLDEAEF